MHACTMPTHYLHLPTQHLHYTCTYTAATYHNIGRWKELSEQPNILPPHTQTPPWHNRKHCYAWVCKHLVQAGVYTKATTAYTRESIDYQRVTTKSARCRQNHQTTRVRDNILKSKEQKTIQPTKGGHKMVTYQNYVSLFYCQITSCPSDGGIS